MKLGPALLLAFLCFFSKAKSQETTETTFGNGMLNVVAKDSSWSVKFAPRLQFRATSDWHYLIEKYGKAEQNFLLRRARLKFSGFASSPALKYKFQIGLSNRDISGASEYMNDAARILIDAVLLWRFHKNFELWAGQTKMPGNLEELVSSGDLQFIDRSLLSSTFGLNRDIGFQLHYFTALSANFPLRLKLSASQGEGRNISSGNFGGHQYTGRLELFPFGKFLGNSEYSQSDLLRESSPKLLLGASYNFNHNAVRTDGNHGDFMINDVGFHNTDISTFFADAMFKYRGFSVMGEFASRSAEKPVSANADGSPATDEDGNLTGYFVPEGEAFNLQMGYLFPKNMEIAARFSQVNFSGNINQNTGKQYTLGVSKYLSGHSLKVQTDFSYAALNGENHGLAFRMGFDLQF